MGGWQFCYVYSIAIFSPHLKFEGAYSLLIPYVWCSEVQLQSFPQPADLAI